MLGNKQDPAALLRIMIEGIEPLDLPLAAQLTVRLITHPKRREYVGRLCDELIDELAQLAEATSQGWPGDRHRMGAAAALSRLEATALS
jgi:hypothetical protein